MFLFIAVRSIKLATLFIFKYISCSYLSTTAIRGTLILYIQIHLMFLFICPPSPVKSLTSLFKYISCSYLSNSAIISAFTVLDSNTSHVLIYLTYSCSMTSSYSYSNTSHVLIYPYKSYRVFASKDNSNTSHVLIYLSEAAGDRKEIPLFKYISCSYLSSVLSPFLFPLY